MKFELDRSLILRMIHLVKDLTPAAEKLRTQYKAQPQKWKNSPAGDDIRTKIENLDATVDAIAGITQEVAQ